jgi:Tfp pilus assembly protein PilW
MLRRFARARRSERGFSLVELVIALSILMVVIGAILSQLTSAQESEHFASDRSAMLDQTRQSMARMTLDIRQASWIDPASDNNHLSMSTYVTGAQATVTYDIVGTDLWRTVGGRPAEKLQTNLAAASIFTYEPSAANAQVVSILLQVQPPASPDAMIQLTSEARLRNIGG